MMTSFFANRVGGSEIRQFVRVHVLVIAVSSELSMDEPASLQLYKVQKYVDP